jgi:hypothetical protein
MNGQPPKWSLEDLSKTIASLLRETSEETITIAAQIAKEMDERNERARQLRVRLREDAARLKSKAHEQAHVPSLITACGRTWREDEHTLGNSLAFTRAELDAGVRVVTEATTSMRQRARNTGECTIRAQETIALAGRTEESLFRYTSECTERINAIKATQVLLDRISAGVAP